MPDFLNVDQVVSYLDIEQDMAIAEFGCGSADFTLALAKKVTRGRLTALDIQEEKLSALKSKLALKGFINVTTILCDLEEVRGSGLADNSQDVVLIPNVLFQAQNKSGIIVEAYRVLKTGGQFLLVDWVANAPFGPKENLAVPQEMKDASAKAGFKLNKEFAAGDYHYALLFTK